MKKFLLLLLCINVAIKSNAQGCADAGFCTAGALKTGSSNFNASKDLGSIGMSATAGYGEQGTIIFIPQLELSKHITKNSSTEIKLPYYIANGNLGTYSGLGDIIATYTRNIYSKANQWDVKATIGGRFSIGTSDKKSDKGLPLPMPYQSNLGTTDLIAGMNFRYRKHYVLAAGIQQPLANYNNNGYYAGAYLSADTAYQQYFSSRMLKRKGDALLRLEYDKDWKNEGIAFSTLFIYHLGNDKITTPVDTTVDATGSSGLTLNITLNYYWNYRNWHFDVGLGGPVIVRDYRPDGLTRALVITPRATYSFKKKK